MQRIDHIMDGILFGALVCAPFYLVWKIGLFLVE